MLDGCVMRGDLRSKDLDATGVPSIDIGRHCLFREKSVIKPPIVAYKE